MKTVFFSLSTSAVFRNLFFFPGSVCDRLDELLRRSAAVRVVLLIPEEHRHKYHEFLTARKSDRFMVEYVSVPLARGILQRMFYFFYSYLIYTGTTYVLATLGLRPDEPPAGGRRYLAPIKRGIAGVFGRSRWIKTVFVPWWYHRIFSERPFSPLFRRWRPILVFAPHIYGQFDTRLLAEAARRGVKTVGMAAGWDHLDKYFLPFRADMLLAQSNHMRDMAIRHQCYSPERVRLVGYPHFDFIVDPRYAVRREELLQSLSLPSGAKILLYVSASAYCPDEPEVIEKILEWIESKALDPEMYLVIRPYLGGRSADREFDRKKFERFEERRRVRFYKREAWGDLEKSIQFMNILRHTDVMISIFTTAMLEAAVFDVPLVTTLFDGTKSRPLHRSVKRFALSEHFKDALATGAVKITYSFDELSRAIRAYLGNPRIDREKREALRSKLLWRLDGRASERIIQAIRQALAAP